MLIKFKNILVFLVLIIFIIFAFSNVGPEVDAENKNISEIEYNFCIETGEISENTMIPMQQFARKTDLEIKKFMDSYYLFRYNDSHMVLQEAETNIRLGSEIIEIDQAPVVINDDILIPVKLVEKFLETELFAREVENREIEREVEMREKSVFQVKPEQTNIKQGEKFAVEIILANKTDSKKEFVFNTGQKFEVELINQQGETEYKWSRGQVFIQAVQRLTLDEGEKRVWEVNIDTTGLKAGDYELQGWLTDRQRSFSPKTVEVKIE